MSEPSSERRSTWRKPAIIYITVWAISYAAIQIYCAVANISAMRIFEQFGWSPDGGDGSTERDIFGASVVVLLLASLVFTSVVTGAIAGWRRYQRHRTALTAE